MNIHRPMFYALRNRTPYPVSDALEWARARASAAQDWIVRQDERGQVRVSTVFMGLDHNFLFNGPPVLYETMICGGEHNHEQWRYCTWAEAEAGHLAALTVAFGPDYQFERFLNKAIKETT